MDRGTRRDRTAAVSRRRFDLRLRFVLPAFLGAVAEPGRRQHPHFYAKLSSLGCPCRARSPGNPKVAGGMCSAGLRDRVYRGRNLNRTIRAAARLREYDWDSDEVSLWRTAWKP